MNWLTNISSFSRICLVVIGLLVLAKADALAQLNTQNGNGLPPTVLPEQTPNKSETTQRGSAHEYLRAGDKSFHRGDFAQAELEYRRASETDPSFKSLYNLGVSLAQQGRSEEAAEQFERAKRYAEEQDEVVDASYNAGNAHLQQEDLKASIQQYVDALRANPDDVEAKQNLAEAIRMVRRQQPPPEQQQQQESDENQEGDESEEQQQQPQEPQEGDSQEEQQPSESEESEDESAEEENEGQPSEPVDVDREEAERLLKLASDQEKKTQEKVRLGEQTRKKPEKDW